MIKVSIVTGNIINGKFTFKDNGEYASLRQTVFNILKRVKEIRKK